MKIQSSTDHATHHVIFDHIFLCSANPLKTKLVHKLGGLATEQWHIQRIENVATELSWNGRRIQQKSEFHKQKLFTFCVESANAWLANMSLSSNFAQNFAFFSFRNWFDCGTNLTCYLWLLITTVASSTQGYTYNIEVLCNHWKGIINSNISNSNNNNNNNSNYRENAF